MTSRAGSCPPTLANKDANQARPPVPGGKVPLLTQQDVATRGALKAVTLRPIDVRASANVSKPVPNSALAAATAANTNAKSSVGDRRIAPLIPATHQDTWKRSHSVSPSRMAALSASARTTPSHGAAALTRPRDLTKSPATMNSARVKNNSDALGASRSAARSAEKEKPTSDLPTPVPIQPRSKIAETGAILALENSILPEDSGSTSTPVGAGSRSPNALAAATKSMPKELITIEKGNDQATSDPVQIHWSWDNTVFSDSRSSMGSSWASSLHPRTDSTVTISPSQSQVDVPSLDPGSIDIPVRGRQPPVGATSSYGARAAAASSLADAIVASSVASSRARSPAKLRPLPASRRRSRSHSVFHYHHHDSQPASPTTPKSPRKMKHTLRGHTRSDAEEEDNVIEKRGRKHYFRKHQHKHHEGDRKRWRDKVSETERRRYEGVWAANRGLYTFWDFSYRGFGGNFNPRPIKEAELVVNVVVREVWERSRLPKDVLEEVWDLVARDDASSLKRDEFVVGMWLIDQRLKGRKLPISISPSVWASVRHTQGVKVSHKPL